MIATRFLQRFGAVLALATVALAGNWTCPDDGSVTPISNLQNPGDYVFKNNGADGTLIVEARDDGGNLVGQIELNGVGDEGTIGVPYGGSATVKDLSDGDKDGATGTYTRET